MDPSGPLFEGNDPQWRLDKTDAAFVEVIHTNADVKNLGMGILDKIGDVDFYLNNGTFQPYCCRKWSREQNISKLLDYPCISKIKHGLCDFKPQEICIL